MALRTSNLTVGSPAGCSGSRGWCLPSDAPPASPREDTRRAGPRKANERTPATAAKSSLRSKEMKSRAPSNPSPGPAAAFRCNVFSAAATSVGLVHPADSSCAVYRPSRSYGLAHGVARESRSSKRAGLGARHRRPPGFGASPTTPGGDDRFIANAHHPPATSSRSRIRIRVHASAQEVDRQPSARVRLRHAGRFTMLCANNAAPGHPT